MKRVLLQLLMIACVAAECSLSSCNQRSFNKESSSPQEEEADFKGLLDSLNRLNISSYEESNEIRKYVAARLNREKPKNNLSDYFTTVPYDSFPPFECLAMLNSGKIGGTCGLASFILAKLYGYAGYTTYIYDCGFDKSGYTHQFTLIESDRKLIIQDAHYNLTIVDSNGGPKDFIQILSEIKTGNFSNIQLEQSDFKKNGRLINFNVIATRRLPGMKPLLQREGLPENYLSIYLKPLYIMDGNSGQKENELTRKIHSVIHYQ